MKNDTDKDGYVPPICELHIKYIIKLHGQDIELTELEAKELLKLLQANVHTGTVYIGSTFTTNA